MSADNWTYCPECKRTLEENLINISAEIESKYGVISFSEHNELIKKESELKLQLNLIKSRDIHTKTLREDYEIGINEDNFSIYYSAGCSKCNYKFSYEISKDALINK